MKKLSKQQAKLLADLKNGNHFIRSAQVRTLFSLQALGLVGSVNGVWMAKEESK